MPTVERITDVDTGGGAILRASPNVFANDLNLAYPGLPVSSHCCDYPHTSPVTKGGSSTVFVNDKPVLHVDDVDSCGHKRSTTSPDVIVGA